MIKTPVLYKFFPEINPKVCDICGNEKRRVITINYHRNAQKARYQVDPEGPMKYLSICHLCLMVISQHADSIWTKD